MKVKFIFSIFVMFLISFSTSAIDVKLSDKGILPNTNKDITNKLQTVLRKCSHKSDVNFIFSRGTYNISRTIEINFTKANQKITLTGNKSIIKLTNSGRDVIVVNAYSNQIRNSINLSSFELDGGISLKQRMKMYDGLKWNIGLKINKVRDIRIGNCIVRNIYGTGIKIGQDRIKTLAIPKKNRSRVYVANCIVKNCAGANPKKDYYKNGKLRAHDNYGDGINITGGYSARIDRCTVDNELNNTNHFGRCGMVFSFSSMKDSVTNCTIKGYDRNIHIESSYGGQYINNNNLTNCRSGIIVSGHAQRNIDRKNFPITITNNTISNGKSFGVVKGRAMNPKALIFFYKNNPTSKKNVIENNEIIIVKDASLNARDYRFIVLLHQENITFNDNRVLADVSYTPKLYIHNSIKSVQNNDYFNLKGIINRKPAAIKRNNTRLKKMPSLK